MASLVGKEQSFSILQLKPLALPISNPPQKRFFITQVTLRSLAFAFTLVAVCVMVTSGQTVFAYGIPFDAQYKYASALRFLVVVDAVACALSLLSLVFVCVFGRSASNPRNYFFVFLHDIVIMVLVISGCAAATAIGYVGRYGQPRMGWMAICSYASNFCDRTVISVVFSFMAFLSFLALTVTPATVLYSHWGNDQNQEETQH
ncbi:hypothetical protein L1049_001962 [Liquidambar formosana]|uniref:CASP-like protein n=1 Tax=Liquidambar formosana TaxID=63359 RepID=A0AAP0NEP7_LIQFO